MAACPHAEIISPYFSHMKELLVAGIVLGDVDVSNLRKSTAKSLYTSFTTSFPPPKIVYKYEAEVDWSSVWMRLQSPMLEPRAKEAMFMIVHNIVPNRDRLHNKFNMVPDQNCIHCRVLHDNVYVFCQCQLVRESWFWVRHDMMFEKLWLLGIRVEIVWNNVISKKKSAKQAGRSRAKLEFS